MFVFLFLMAFALFICIAWGWVSISGWIEEKKEDKRQLANTDNPGNIMEIIDRSNRGSVQFHQISHGDVFKFGKSIYVKIEPVTRHSAWDETGKGYGAGNAVNLIHHCLSLIFPADLVMPVKSKLILE
jgi:hypothetical protein